MIRLATTSLKALEEQMGIEDPARSCNDRLDCLEEELYGRDRSVKTGCDHGGPTCLMLRIKLIEDDLLEVPITEWNRYLEEH